MNHIWFSHRSVACWVWPVCCAGRCRQRTVGCVNVGDHREAIHAQQAKVPPEAYFLGRASSPLLVLHQPVVWQAALEEASKEPVSSQTRCFAG